MLAQELSLEDAAHGRQLLVKRLLDMYDLLAVDPDDLDVGEFDCIDSSPALLLLGSRSQQWRSDSPLRIGPSAWVTSSTDYARFPAFWVTLVADHRSS
jgi:hypothetical protein